MAQPLIEVIRARKLALLISPGAQLAWPPLKAVIEEGLPRV